VHRVICSNNYPTRCNNIQFIYICKLFALPVSGGIYTHYQEFITLYLQYLALMLGTADTVL